MSGLYMLVEGQRTEPALFRSWIPALIPGMTEILKPDDVDTTSPAFYLLAGHGYPSLIRRIGDAIADVQRFRSFSRLVVALDAEERSRREVHEEIAAHLAGCPVAWQVVVADCCVETWLLGNRAFIPRNPRAAELVDLRRQYDVRTSDPELMPKLKRPDGRPFRNRASSHVGYLRLAFQERRKLYTKTNPGEAATERYLGQLRARARGADDPPHLSSFGVLLEVAAAHARSLATVSDGATGGS